MFTILTSRPGQYRTEPASDMMVVEHYDYLFYGRKQASFTIASMDGPTRVHVIDASDAQLVNVVPSKFLEQYATLEEARAALQSLTRFGSMDMKLVKT